MTSVITSYEMCSLIGTISQSESPFLLRLRKQISFLVTVSIRCHWLEEKNLSISVISASVMKLSLFHTDVGM